LNKVAQQHQIEKSQNQEKKVILNYQLHQNANKAAPVIVFIHGLFGSLSNLGMLARHYYEHYTVIQLDLRNHGLSGHHDQHNYQHMAQDVLETLENLNYQKINLVGHSMGGKVVMQLAQIAEHLIEKIIVLDMAPVSYTERHHDEIFSALFAVQQASPTSRTEATTLMGEYLTEEMVIQFLLKSWQKGQWLFNVDALYQNYGEILSWKNVSSTLPVLFIKGGRSFYISSDAHLNAIKNQFSQSEIKVVEGAGHWLHAEKTAQVLAYIDDFLAE
jgi:esterase